MVLGHHHPGWWEDLLHYKLLIITELTNNHGLTITWPSVMMVDVLDCWASAIFITPGKDGMGTP